MRKVLVCPKCKVKKKFGCIKDNKIRLCDECDSSTRDCLKYFLNHKVQVVSEECVDHYDPS